MKYLRSYLLVPGAGGQILGGPFRRVTTGHTPAKVTSSETYNNFIPSTGTKRRVSTDGAKKSQLAVVGQVAPALPPPNGAEIGPYVRISRHNDAKTPRQTYPLDDHVCPRHGNPCISVPKESPEPMSYGQFLSESNSLKATFVDPGALEMAFLPTFHAFKNDVSGLFFSDRPKSAGIPYSSSLDSPPRNSDDAIPRHPDIIELDRSKSLEALLPTDNTIPVDDASPKVSVRSVKREIVLPRTFEPNALSSDSFNAFLEVHNFQKKESGQEGEKTEDISPFPKCEDTPDPLAPFIIHNDRTSIIIHRDLYITNRILEKLKQMEDNVEITPEPTIRASTVSDHLATCGGDQCTTNSCNKCLIYSDSTALVDIAESADVGSMSGKAVASRVSKGADLEAVTEPITAHNVGQPVTNIVGSPIVQSPNSSQVSQHQNGKTGSRITNAELEMSRGRLTRLEYLALQSRKNLYARMKNVSSPCVLIDGVNVQHKKLEEAIPGVGSCAMADTNCPSVVPSESRIPGGLVPVTRGQNLAGRENDFNPRPSTASEHPTTAPETRPISVTSTNRDILPPAKIDSPTVIDFPQTSVFCNHFMAESVEPYADFGSQVQGFSEANQSEIAGHDLDPFQSIGDLKSDLIQNDLEDWFIPLGKEIESMLLTLEASKALIAKDCPEYLPHDFQEIEEGIFNIVEHGDLKPFEEVDTIGSALLSPRGHQPFEPGQSRDKSTSKGRLPPKLQNPNVDVKTETTIKCTRSGESTDINVTETQRYLDKRLPYPFCTETVLQVCGTSSSLHEATQAVENSKSQLVHLSNANSPNPGMLTPKLQFNHMLSKSHENLKPNSKKTVLKIKVVPNAASSPSVQSSEPKPKPSHILQLTEEPRKTSTDVSKLIRRTKFNHKPGPKKARRGDTMMKLRPKKKLNKESGENIKVLSPKDLEKMFPSPPKPKPVEKPRKVTIETKAGKEHPDLVENVKQKSSQSGFTAAQFKSRKVQDGILKRPDLKSPAEVKVVIQPENEGADVTTMKSDLVLKNQNNAALSARDQKILKSIISHKVKDSYMAVTKKAAVNPEVKNEKQELEKLKPTVSQVVSNFPAPEARYEKSDKVYHNDPKTVYAKILETAKEKPVKEKTPLKGPRPKSPRPESPTPKPNREYITVKTEPPTKTPRALNNANPVNARATTEKKPEGKLDENVLPVSASAIIANVMKGSTDVSQSESRWHHLDSKTASDPAPDEKLSVDKPKSADVQRRSWSAESSAVQKSQVSDAKMNVGKTSQDKSVQKKEHGNIAEKDSFREKNLWNLPSEPLFFPFETPNYKEILQEPPPNTTTIDPIPIKSSNPKSAASATYQMDFCKLCTENTPGLDPPPSPRYRIPLEKVKTFPLVNPGKAKAYSVPSSGAMSINPVHDLMMMRNLRRIPAVTKVLGATLSAKSQQALDRWKEGLISTLGEEGFQVFYRNQMKRGSDFHSTVRKFLAERLECKDDLCMQSLSKVLGSVSEVSVIESQVVHPLLGYRGVVDCVAKYKGKPVVIEWKRSDKSKPSLKHTYDAPLQLSAYLGAMNFDSNYKAQQVEGGIVAVAYSDGSPADVFELSAEEIERYWAKWLKRLHKFYNTSS